MRKLIIDIETKNTFEDINSRDPAGLDIALLVVYDFITNSYQSYDEGKLKDLWPLVEKSDMIIGFNSLNFDIPLLNKYYPGDLTKLKNLDLLEEVRKAIGRRVSLNALAVGTLGREKSGDGLEAVRWWREGKFQKIFDYCKEDVRLTKDLYEFALINGYLKYKLIADVYQFPIDTSEWEKGGQTSINYTLPF